LGIKVDKSVLKGKEEERSSSRLQVPGCREDSSKFWLPGFEWQVIGLLSL
jgi:hypothetical protein